MRVARHAAAILVLAATLGGAVSVASAQGSALDDPRLEAVREQLEAHVRSATREGLPAAILVDKVREGLAKRVPPPRIAMAVRMLLGHLRTADDLLEGVPAHRRVRRAGLVRVTAEALMVGAGEGELGRLVAAITDAQPDNAAPLVQEGMTVVAELAERGIEGGLAADSTRRAFQTQGRQGWSDLLRTVRALGRASAAERTRAVQRAAEGPRGGAPGFDGHPHGGPKGHAKGKGR